MLEIKKGILKGILSKAVLSHSKDYLCVFLLLLLGKYKKGMAGWLYPFFVYSLNASFSVFLCMDLMNTYINRSTTLNINQCTQINKSLLLINILYSIKLKDLNNALDLKCKTAAMGRVAFIFLNHFNNYRRNIKYDLMQLYNLQGYTATRALNALIENGLVLQVGCKRKTNIGLYVGLDSYQITVKGRDSIKAINTIFERRFSGLNT
jgi:hypothetical protein